jgi:hypothetical protein
MNQMTDMRMTPRRVLQAADSERANGLLECRSMFWRPHYLAKSAWIEHIPFAFWVMQAHQPKVFVELGTHYGTSYFAFCQAVDRLALDTRCFAIDTWKGDEHAGFYDGAVFAKVREHNDANFSGFSRLIRSTFDEALSHFSESSIDLLHIDGHHTLESVQHDFDVWLPKLSPRAVVLLHDTNVREKGFGVFKFMEGLRDRYPSFEFVHGHGLGVVAVGKEQSEIMNDFFDAEARTHNYQEARETFSRLGHACADAMQNAILREQETILAKQVTDLQKRVTDISTEKEKISSDLSIRARERDAARQEVLKAREETAAERAYLTAQTEFLRTELEKLRSLVKEAEAEARTLRNDAMSENRKLHDTAVENAVSTAEAGMLRREVEIARSRLAEFEQNTKRLETENAALAHAHSQNTQKLEALMNELVESQTALNSLNDTLENDRRVIGTLTQAIQEEKIKNDEAARQDEELRKKLSDSQRESGVLKANNRELENNVEIRFREIGTLTQALQEQQMKNDEAARQESGLRKKIFRENVRLVGGIAKYSPTFKKNNFLFRKKLRKAAISSGIFDHNWYINTYKDIGDAGVDAFKHYIRYGAAEGRNPSPFFSTSAYYKKRPELKKQDINPLFHFLLDENGNENY